MFDQTNYENILSEIDKNGFAQVGVVNDAEAYFYTVGCLELIGTELYVEALQPSNADVLLNSVVNILSVREEKKLPDAVIVNGVLAHGYKLGVVRVEDVSVKSSKSLYASAHHESDQYKLYQLMLPDQQNNLPWEVGYDHKGMSNQGQLNPKLVSSLKDNEISIPEISVQGLTSNKQIH